MTYKFELPDGMQLARDDGWTVIEDAEALDKFLKEKKLFVWQLKGGTKVGFGKKENPSYIKIKSEEFLQELERRGCYAAIDGHGFGKVFKFKAK